MYRPLKITAMHILPTKSTWIFVQALKLYDCDQTTIAALIARPLRRYAARGCGDDVETKFPHA